MKEKIRKQLHGICSPKGFLAGAVACGIKPGGKVRDDLALIVSEVPAFAAATFTTNRVKAAPVLVSKSHLSSRTIRGIVLNSGNANACTGEEGMAHALRTTEVFAEALGTSPQQMLVCSTGRIGIPLPIKKIEKAAPSLVSVINKRGSLAAAKAIMTSDTQPKEVAYSVSCGNRTFAVGGIAKGAGMIDPNMATMLAVLTTDAPLTKGVLGQILRSAVQQSFNRITVDGDMSTNDTVIMLANGMEGGEKVKFTTDEYYCLESMVEQVCRELARKIVEDGEGTTKVIEVEVRGAATFAHARRAAEAVANSTLTKCAWAGGDPNWGRILDALGYSGVPIDPDIVDIYYNQYLVAFRGMASKTPLAKLRKIAAKPSFRVTIDLHMGNRIHEIWTTDLTEAYVQLNLGE